MINYQISLLSTFSQDVQWSILIHWCRTLINLRIDQYVVLGHKLKRRVAGTFDGLHREKNAHTTTSVDGIIFGDITIQQVNVVTFLYTNISSDTHMPNTVLVYRHTQNKVKWAFVDITTLFVSQKRMMTCLTTNASIISNL